MILTASSSVMARMAFSCNFCAAVPDEGFEPPTFGLQNRCSTTELIRLYWCFIHRCPQISTIYLPIFSGMTPSAHRRTQMKRERREREEREQWQETRLRRAT